jgi:signal-transduction protein with cAMP-binding, CBS, and nucleotidyltransferase domain
MTEVRSPVREVMSRGAITVDEKTTLRSVAAVLAELDIGVAVVALPDGSAGIVSERDVTRALANDADPDEVWAADVMTPDLVIVEPDETVLDAASRITTEGVRHLAVVDRGTIVGVVSARDVLAVLSDHLAGA